MSEAAVLWEREVASAAIAAMLERAAAGTPGALFINGDPGLGKTALVDRARQLAAQRGFLVGSGRGDPMETSLPFGLLNQAFSELGRTTIVQDAGSEPAGPDARGAQFYGALRWLRDLGAGPVLIALDDLHWADADSLSLLSFLCRRLAPLNIAVMGALRSWPPEAGGLAARLAGDGCADTLPLAPLGAASAGALLTARLGRDVPADEAELAWEVSAGNPLLLEQLALMVGSGQEIPGRTGPGAHARPMDMLLARFAGLPAAGMRCAQAAAVLGGRFRAGLALELAQLDDTAGYLALEALDRSGLVRQAAGGGMRFVHPLFRQALYDDLGAAQRGRLHARAFTLLADRGLDAEAAEHATKADMTGNSQAIAVLERVGRAARRGGAVGSAMRVLESAVALAGEHARPELLLDLAEVMASGGRPADAVGVCERILAKSSLPVMIRAKSLRALGQALIYTGAFEAAAQRIGESVDLAEDADPAFAVDTLLAYGLVAELTAGPATAISLNRRAMQIAGACDPMVRRGATSTWAVRALETGDASGLATCEAAARAEEAESPSPSGIGPFAGAGSLAGYADVARWTERLSDAEYFARLRLGRAEQHGSVEVEAAALAACIDASMRLLRFDEVAVYVDRWARLSDLVPLAGPFAQVARANLLLFTGRLEESDQAARQVEPIIALVGFWSLSLWLSWGQAWRCVSEGRLAEACALYEQMEAVTARAGCREPCEVPWASHAVAAYAGCGRTADASRVLAWLDDCAQGLPCRWPRIAAATGRARLAESAGDHGAAEAFFRQALDLHGETDLPLERLQTLLEYGRFLRRSGHPARARPPLAQAYQLAADAGAHWLADQASQELKVAGGRRRRRARAPDPARAASSRARRCAAEQQGDRRSALCLRENGRDSPGTDLRQTRHPLPEGTARCHQAPRPADGLTGKGYGPFPDAHHRFQAHTRFIRRPGPRREPSQGPVSMSPDDRHDPAGQAGSDQLTALVLELSLDSGEPIGGFVGRAGEQMRLPFRGWVDLMSAINSIRAAAGNTDEVFPPR